MSETLRSLTAAGFTSEGTFVMPQLLAGEQDLITTSLPLAANTAISKNKVLALDASGNLVALNPAGTGGTATEAVAVCIAVEAVASVAAVQNIPVYIAGYFNHEALVWPAGTSHDTLAERRAAFPVGRSNITIGAISAVA